MMMYEDTIVSDDMSDTCPEADMLHQVTVQDDFLITMKDALAVNNERTAWT